jgi:hypothetical protein
MAVSPQTLDTLLRRSKRAGGYSARYFAREVPRQFLKRSIAVEAHTLAWLLPLQ